MASDDLILAAIASKLIQPKTATQTGTPQTPPAQPVGLTNEQLNSIAGAVRSGVESGLSNLQLPAINVQPPEVTVQPPEVNVPQTEITFPPNLAVRFSDDELARLASAIRPQNVPKSNIYQRTILIDIGTATVPNSTFVNAEFPAGVKVASFDFAQQSSLIGVTLSASIVNTFTKPCGFFAALSNTDRLNFDATPYTTTAEVGKPKTPDSQILLSVFTHQNSTPTTINPNTRAAAISFGLDNAVTLVNSQTTLSLYAFQTINAGTGLGEPGQLMSAILTAYYIPIEG